MLASYRVLTRNLLQNPSAPTSLYDQPTIDLDINIARRQAAGEGECIRTLGTLSTVIGQRNYAFSAINTGASASSGIAGIIHVRAINYLIGVNGLQWIPPRNWEWFNLYSLNNPVPVNGAPTSWSQFAQGAGGTGSGSGASGNFYLDPPPDLVYTLYLDCVCYPISLVDDTTVEALPYLWTDAVPFFAAYYALLGSQTSTRQADANRMFEAYQTFMQRARQMANPSVTRYLYQQSPDPTMIAKLGLQTKNNAAAGG